MPVLTTKKFSGEDQRLLTVAMSKVCQFQTGYGKTAQELPALIDSLLWALDGYPMSEIIGAIREHVRRKPTIPTPSDIVNIIDPLPPKLCPVMYSNLKKERADGYSFFSDEKKDYIRRYEEQELNKVRS